MQSTLKAQLAFELLNSQVLLNTEGIGLKSSLLWGYTTKFPGTSLTPMDGDELFEPQGLWITAPQSIVDTNDATGYTYTFDESKTVYNQVVLRTAYNSTIQQIDRIYMQNAVDALSSEVKVFVSLDAIDWTLVYTGTMSSNGEFLLGSNIDVRFILFQYKVQSKTTAPYGSFTIYRAAGLKGSAKFNPTSETGLSLRGARLVLDNKYGGLGSSSTAAFTGDIPMKDSLNIYTRPYSQDNINSRPAIYFGAFDLESSDKLDWQTVSSEGICQYRTLHIPLVITAYGTSYQEAEYRRDVIRAKVRRILMQVPTNQYWYLLEISGNKDDTTETCIATGSGGGEGRGQWEAICSIPVVIRYKLTTNGALLP